MKRKKANAWDLPPYIAYSRVKRIGGGVLYVKRIYRISPEYARENRLAYLERVETSIGGFALPDGDTINAARA